jgi:uncharacterized protein with GYD domain
MALFMWLARYTPQAVKTIVESGSNREEMARHTVESAGGKLLGFYGLIGQEHHIALICDVPKQSDFIGIVLRANLGGAIESFKTVPLFDWPEFEDALKTYSSLSGVYTPPS